MKSYLSHAPKLISILQFYSEFSFYSPSHVTHAKYVISLPVETGFTLARARLKTMEKKCRSSRGVKLHMSSFSSFDLASDT